MTAENYISTISSKSTADLLKISSSFLKFAVSWKDIWILAILFAVTGCLIYFFGKSIRSCYRKVFLGSALIYILYQLGMLAMYLFSMPTGEALRLASSVRYSKTIIIAIAYADMIPALVLISDIPLSKASASLVSLCIPVSVCVFLYSTVGSLKPQMEYSSAERVWMEATICEYDIPEYDSYCIIFSPSSATQRNYLKYIARYLLHSAAFHDVEADDLNWVTISEHYIFVVDPENEAVLDWTRTNFPDQVGRHVILQ